MYSLHCICLYGYYINLSICKQTVAVIYCCCHYQRLSVSAFAFLDFHISLISISNFICLSQYNIYFYFLFIYTRSDIYLSISVYLFFYICIYIFVCIYICTIFISVFISISRSIFLRLYLELYRFQ